MSAIITNGSFELGQSPWTFYLGSNPAPTFTNPVDARPGSSGTLSAKVVATVTSGSVGFQQDITLVVGRTYELDVWYKCPSGDFMFYVVCADASWNPIATWRSPGYFPSTTTWTNIKLIAGPVPSGTVHTWISFDLDSTGEFQIDDIVMTLMALFNDNFENGLTPWDSPAQTGLGGTVTVQSTTKYRGTYALDASLPATAGAYAIVLKTFASTYTTFFARAYVRFSALPTSPNYLEINPSICDSLNNTLVGVCIQNNAGTYRWALRYRTNTVAINWVYNTTPTPAINTWYCIEIKCTVGLGTGEARLWVDGVEVAWITGLTNNNKVPQQVQVGASTSGSGALLVHVYTDSAFADTQYIGFNLAVQSSSPIGELGVTVQVDTTLYTIPINLVGITRGTHTLTTQAEVTR